MCFQSEIFYWIIKSGQPDTKVLAHNGIWIKELWNDDGDEDATIHHGSFTMYINSASLLLSQSSPLFRRDHTPSIMDAY